MQQDLLRNEEVDQPNSGESAMEEEKHDKILSIKCNEQVGRDNEALSKETLADDTTEAEESMVPIAEDPSVDKVSYHIWKKFV